MKNRRSIIINVAILFAISLLIMSKQLSSKAFFSCHGEDTFAYVSWAWQFVEVLKEGIIYPRWLPFNYWDYGGPSFLLLPPLAFYLAAFFSIFTGSVITAMNITKFLSLFLSGTGMFFLVREFYSEKIAILTASFYIVFPYNIFQFYYVGTFASTVSFMWFSPILLFTYRYMRDKHYRYVLYAGLCYGGLILTHLINAYMFTFMLVAFIIYLSLAKKHYKDLVAIAFITIMGFLLSAAYVLPVLFEKQFINLQGFLGGDRGREFLFDYRNFFILPDMTNKFSTGHLWQAYYDMFVFYVILFSILIILCFLQIVKTKKLKAMKDTNLVNYFFLGTALCTIFLLFGLSTFIWENIPFFKYVQFSHRWLNITTFTVVFLSAVTFWVLRNSSKTRKEHAVLIIIICFICIISIFLDYKYIRYSPFIHEQELFPARAVNWYSEHLPIWVDIEKIDKSEDTKQPVAIQEGEGRVEVMAWKSAERVIAIKASNPSILWIRTFNFPGWRAYVDGVQTEIKTEKDVGAMLIDIPKGKHELVLRFEDTPVRYYSKIISLVSFSIAGFLLFFFRKKRDK